MTESNTDRFYRLQQEQIERERKEAQEAAAEFLRRAEALKEAAEKLQREAEEVIKRVKQDG